MSTHGSTRLFFAIELNNELRCALAQVIDELKCEPWSHRVKWMNPENLHVTLRFLGNPNTSLAVTAVAEHANKVTKEIEPFPLQLHNIRFFPSPTAPRAIVADIIPTPGLFELAHSLEEVAGKLGFAPETKPYLPHLTLGRIIHHHTSNLREEIKLNTNPMLVNEIVLFNSEKTEHHQSYTPLEYIPLALKTAKSSNPERALS